MKKILPVLLLAVMIVGTLGIYIAQNWDPYRNVPQVSLDRLNRQEAEWYAQGIWNYRVLVLVRFATEQRRYQIEVRDNIIADAKSSRWDEDQETWGPFTTAGTEEADFFTIPGLFGMLRADLRNEEVDREVMRMGLADGQTYPGLIYLGDIIQDGVSVDGTDLVIEVLEFERLDG